MSCHINKNIVLLINWLLQFVKCFLRWEKVFYIMIYRHSEASVSEWKWKWQKNVFLNSFNSSLFQYELIFDYVVLSRTSCVLTWASEESSFTSFNVARWRVCRSTKKLWWQCYVLWWFYGNYWAHLFL